jgi:hypothetical protein
MWEDEFIKPSGLDLLLRWIATWLEANSSEKHPPAFDA